MINFKKDFAEAYNNLGTCFEKLKNYEDSITSFEKAILLKKNFPEAIDVVKKLNEIGFDAFIQKNDTNPDARYRIRYGNFSSREDASKTADIIKEKLGYDCWINQVEL